jgi:hypothetical protein
MALELTLDERLNRATRSLRHFIRDKQELNRLLLNRNESSDEELKQCLCQAIMDWNGSPPPLPIVDLASHPNKYLLLQCAAYMALTGAGIWHSREHMPSQDGGTSADDHAKASEYSGWIGTLYQDYEQKKEKQKISMNLMSAINGQGIPSEYGQTFYYGGEYW